MEMRQLTPADIPMDTFQLLTTTDFFAELKTHLAI